MSKDRIVVHGTLPVDAYQRRVQGQPRKHAPDVPATEKGDNDMQYATRRHAVIALRKQGKTWIRLCIGRTESNMQPITLSLDEYLAGEYESDGVLHQFADPDFRAVEAVSCCGIVMLIIENNQGGVTSAAVF